MIAARFLRLNSLRIAKAIKVLKVLNLSTILRICGDFTWSSAFCQFLIKNSFTGTLENNSNSKKSTKVKHCE